MANPKPNATVFFEDGRSLDVVETVAAIEALYSGGGAGGQRFWFCIHLTKPTSDVVWVNLLHVCRIEPA